MFPFRDFGKIAAATSNKSVHLYDLSCNKGFTPLHKYDMDAEMCDISFGNETQLNTLYVGLTDGKVYTYDLRSKPTPVQIFKYVDSTRKPFMSFDVNASDSCVAVGTEQCAGEAHILLFDVRKCSPINVFSDSHRDDLTQIRFHPLNNNIMASASTDGLINVFDITKSDEDEAIEFSLNTESSIQTINWHFKENGKNLDTNWADFLSCITHTNDFQLFDTDTIDQIYKCEREHIAKLIKRQSVSDCYLINCHTTSSHEIVLLTGSNFNSGECFRSLMLHDAKEFIPQNNFMGNKQIIRCSVYNSQVKFCQLQLSLHIFIIFIL